MSKQKLELTWIGKERRPQLEPRILLEEQELSYHAHHRMSRDDIFDNRLIFGDNLLALKALEQEHCFVLSDAKLPHLCEAREEMLKWLWARSLFKSKGNSAKAANLLGVTPTYIRKLTKTIPRHLTNAKKPQKA